MHCSWPRGLNGCACPGLGSGNTATSCAAVNVGLMNRDTRASAHAGQQTSALTTSTSPPVSHTCSSLHNITSFYISVYNSNMPLTTVLHPAFHLGDISTEPHFSLQNDLHATMLTPPHEGRRLRGKDKRIVYRSAYDSTHSETSV